MAVVNALDLPKDSPFRDPKQIPLLEPLLPLLVQTSASIEEEDSPSMKELVEEIDSHTKVIDLDNSITLGATEGQELTALLLNPSPLGGHRYCYHFP